MRMSRTNPTCVTGLRQDVRGVEWIKRDSVLGGVIHKRTRARFASVPRYRRRRRAWHAKPAQRPRRERAAGSGTAVTVRMASSPPPERAKLKLKLVVSALATVVTPSEFEPARPSMRV